MPNEYTPILVNDYSSEENDEPGESIETDPIISPAPNRIEDSLPAERPLEKEKWRNLIAFWFLGLTNNFAYVVMLSAAHDILSNDFNNNKESHLSRNVSEVEVATIENSTRDCNMQSTGIILLADIIPSLSVKLVAPFIGYYLHYRICATVILCGISFLLVGVASSSSVAILGVICASASAGLGEVTLLAYCSFYHRDVISTWASGTGAAGLLGSISYAALTSLGFSSRQSVLLMLVVPIVMSISFWIVLEHQDENKCCQNRRRRHSYRDIFEDDREVTDVPRVRLTFDQKVQLIPSFAKYMIPLSLVYMAEYLINQGLAELIFFPSDVSWINHKEQYRWYQVIYQIGVFISRSSVNIVYIDKLWIPALFQWINVAFFLSIAIFWWIGSIWLVFLMILWEGLLGGAAYVNTFFKVSKETCPEHQEFAIQLTSMSDTLGITFAGFIAIPLHNAICNLPVL